MTPEEKLNHQIWQVLQDVREQWLVSPKGKPVKYRIPNVIGGSAVPKQRRIDVLYKLEEQGAFKIHTNADGQRLTNRGKDAFYLIIEPSRFDQIYDEYRQKANKAESIDAIDYSDTALRREYVKKWEIIKILKSHYVAKENPKIILVWAKAFLVGEVKTLTDAVSYFSVFQQAGCFKKYGLDKDGNYYAFLDFNKEKLFETYRTIEKHYKRFAEEYQKTHPPVPPAPFDWTALSQKNLELAQKVIEITSSYFELNHVNRLTQSSRIPWAKFDGIPLDDISSVLNRIDGIHVINGFLRQALEVNPQSTEQYISSTWGFALDRLPSDLELRVYVFLKINSLHELSRAKNIIDGKLHELRKSSEQNNLSQNLPIPQKSKKQKVFELYLNRVGDLWREPKRKYCYPMGENSGRHKIVRFLASSQGYKTTKNISLELGGKSEQSIRTEIGKIRQNIHEFLDKDGKEVIASRAGSGYGIGAKYKIRIKE